EITGSDEARAENPSISASTTAPRSGYSHRPTRERLRIFVLPSRLVQPIIPPRPHLYKDIPPRVTCATPATPLLPQPVPVAPDRARLALVAAQSRGSLRL